ncbi:MULTISPECIES: hypothetical protein [Nioella]|jgi:hypothetical protein|nr:MULTISPECIES: hypothetical protein [Nioella]
MSNRIKALLALGLLVGAAACAPAPEPEEIIIIDPAPIQAEPVYSNKYD